MNRLLILTIILGVLLRVVPSVNGMFPFMYDHSKDALAMLKIAVAHSPVLYGAVTSIPGVYNGPAPYYFSLPAFVLTKLHPFGSVLTVILSATIGIVLLWKKNRLAGILYATSALAIGSQTSAWYPYMTGIFIIPSLIVLHDLYTKKDASTKNVFIAGISLGLLFHSQTAFGIVSVPTYLFLLLRSKPILSPKTWCSLFAGIALLFLPFFIFELRNDFIQVKSILSFLVDFRSSAQEVSPNQGGLDRVWEIFWSAIQFFSGTISPIGLPWFFAPIVFLLVLKLAISNHKNQFLHLWLPLMTIPLLLYLFLPFKAYYLVGFLPIFILWFAETIKDKRSLTTLVGLLAMLSGGVRLLSGIFFQTPSELDPVHAYRNKESAMKLVYQWSEHQPFESFQFVPEIYDYTYQFLFLREGALGNPLPTRFQYSKDVPEYVVEKSDILRALPKQALDPKKVFIISEIPNPESEIQRIFPNATVLRSSTVADKIQVFEIKN